MKQADVKFILLKHIYAHDKCFIVNSIINHTAFLIIIGDVYKNKMLLPGIFCGIVKGI